MSFLFGSKAQRTFKKVQDLASGDMVDQAAVMVEEELDTLLEDHDVAAKLVPFLMDIGHPDLGGRIGERIVRTHSDLRMPITRLLEEKQTQFPRSFELLRVIWKSRLHQRDFNGLMDVLGRTERVTVNRFADTVQSSAQALNAVRGRELGAGIDRILAWAMITLHRGDPSAAMDILVDAAERCSFPEESLSRLSGWIASRTGGTDMEVNLKRIMVLTAIGDRERAIAELPSLYEAETELLNRAVSLVEKELVPHDDTTKSRISLARLMSRAGRVNDACLILDPLIDRNRDSSLMEQAVTGMVLGAPGSARAHLLQARLRLARGEHTQALDSVDRAFECPDVADSPVVDICRSFIDSGIDREGLVTGKLGEFLVEKGSVEEAVRVLSLSVDSSPEWVLEKLQRLLKRERTSAAVLTLLAVVLLVLERGGEAAATLKHLASRTDIKSKQDIVSVLSEFDHLMAEHTELRRLRAASGASNGRGTEAASDWLELLISGEPVTDQGCLAIFDSGVYKDRSAEILQSGFTPASPAGELVIAGARIHQGISSESTGNLTAAISSPQLVERITGLVSSLPFSSVSAMKPGRLFSELNRNNRGGVVAKLLPLLAVSGAEGWMDDLAGEVMLDTPEETILFRMRYFIETGKPGTGAAAVKGLETENDDISNLVKGCTLAAAGDVQAAVEHLSRAASGERTASLARTVLSSLTQRDSGSPLGAIALARAEIKIGDTASAAKTLKPVLGEKEVLDFLEEAVLRAPGAHEIHGVLALARLMAGDPRGFMESAGTAAEGDTELMEEILRTGASYSLDNHLPRGMVFIAELGMKYMEDYDPSDLLVRALCLEPDLHGRISALGCEDPLLQMLLALAARTATGFTAVGVPEGAGIPIDMIREAHSEWGESKATEALLQLEILAGCADYPEEAHAIRVTLSGLGEDRSVVLLRDALENPGYRMDFLRLCQSEKTAESSIDALYPGGIAEAGEGEMEALTEMLLRCGSRDTIFNLALDLLKTGSPANGASAGRIVDEYLPTAGEEGSLTVEQVIDLLLMSGRVFEAFEMARGDSAFLARVRARVSEMDAGSNTPEGLIRSGRAVQALSMKEIREDPMKWGEALWRTGERMAACGVWRKAYAETSRPEYLARLHYALECMGASSEAAAARRLLSENHPDHLQRTGRTGVSGGKLSMITYSF